MAHKVYTCLTAFSVLVTVPTNALYALSMKPLKLMMKLKELMWLIKLK